MDVDVEGYAVEMEQRVWAAAFALAVAGFSGHGGSHKLRALKAREAAEKADRTLELYRIAEEEG